jgi:hypothetical protein
MVDPENTHELRDKLHEILKDSPRPPALNPAVVFSRENHKSGVAGIIRLLGVVSRA